MMQSRVDFVRKLWALNHVRRWNFHPHSREESVAEHSFWVAALTVMFGGSTDDVIYALFHDAEEAITSDIPGLVKKRLPEPMKKLKEIVIHELTQNDKEIEALLSEPKPEVKAADLVASFLFAEEEVIRGNRYFERIRGELIESIFTTGYGPAIEFLRLSGIRPGDGFSAHKEISHL